MHATFFHSCPALCDPMDCSPPDSSVHGILQARLLEWVAMPSSRGSSRLRDQTCVSHVSCAGRWVLSFILFLTMETLLFLKMSVQMSLPL